MAQTQSVNIKAKANGKNKMAKSAQKKQPLKFLTKTPAKGKSTRDFMVCKEAMENPKVFAELAR